MPSARVSLGLPVCEDLPSRLNHYPHSFPAGPVAPENPQAPEHEDDARRRGAKCAQERDEHHLTERHIALNFFAVRLRQALTASSTPATRRLPALP